MAGRRLWRAPAMQYHCAARERLCCEASVVPSLAPSQLTCDANRWVQRALTAKGMLLCLSYKARAAVKL